MLKEGGKRRSKQIDEDKGFSLHSPPHAPACSLFLLITLHIILGLCIIFCLWGDHVCIGLSGEIVGRGTGVDSKNTKVQEEKRSGGHVKEKERALAHAVEAPVLVLTLPTNLCDGR